jgi:hypothetical protein
MEQGRWDRPHGQRTIRRELHGHRPDYRGDARESSPPLRLVVRVGQPIEPLHLSDPREDVIDTVGPVWGCPDRPPLEGLIEAREATAFEPVSLNESPALGEREDGRFGVEAQEIGSDPSVVLGRAIEAVGVVWTSIGTRDAEDGRHLPTHRPDKRCARAGQHLDPSEVDP